MKLLELQVRRFRNIESLDWNPAPGISLIVGENGQGKTNLLESIYFGVLGRSFRTRREEQCLPWNLGQEGPGAAGAVIQSTLKGVASTRRLKVALGRGVKRAWADGVLVPRLGDLWNGSGVVVFSPADVELFRAGPGDRRVFLDQLLSLGSRAYFAHLQRYQRALRQVNAALKPRSAGQFGLDAAEPFYRILSEAGGELVALRRKAVDELEAMGRGAYAALDGTGEFGLRYEANARTTEGGDEGAREVAAALHARLMSRHEESRRMGAVDSGPHRDDLRAELSGRDLGKFGSQGQHRLAALALKLASADWLERGLNDAPLLLLDDFGSELDRRRRDAVIEYLRGRMQTFITATGVEALGEASRFDEVREMRGGGWA